MTVATTRSIDEGSELRAMPPGAAELARAIAAGASSSRDVVEEHLGRIAARNPSLNAVVTLDETSARAAADEADRAARRGDPLGPLHGVPVTIKDTFATAGLRTTSGSQRLASYVPARDDTVAALRAVGATVERACPPEFDPLELAALASEVEFSSTRATRTPLHLPRLFFRGAAGILAGSDRAAAGFVRGMGATIGSLARAMSRRDRAIDSLERFLVSRDAWLVPVAAMAAFPHLRRGGILDQLRATIDVDGRPVPLVAALEAFASPFNLTGSPAVVVPAGRSAEGLPIGLQLVGRRWDDMRLLAVARAVCRTAGIPS